MNKTINKENMDKNHDVIKKTRMNGRNIIEYKGYEYYYSNPLKIKSGKNWKCALSSCKGTIKTIINDKGDEEVSMGIKHNHPSKSSNNSIMILRESKNKLNESNPMIDLKKNNIPSDNDSVNNEKIDKPKETEIISLLLEDKNTSLDQKSINIQDDKDCSPYQHLSMISTPGALNLGLSIAEYDVSPTTPVTVENIQDLRRQIRGLVQEIINKQILIDKLEKKSKEDDTLIKNMIQSIRMLEDENKVKNVTLNDQPTFVDNSSGRKKIIKILGDSHVRNLNHFIKKELPHNYVTKFYYKPGACFDQVSKLDPVEDNSDIVVVIAGTNDVCNSLWYSVENAIVDLSKRYVDKQVFIVLTPYRRDKTVLNKYINIFNNNVKNLVRNLENVKYIDIQNIFAINDYSFDGIHFNRMGKIKICKKIKDALTRPQKKYEYSANHRSNSYNNRRDFNQGINIALQKKHNQNKSFNTNYPTNKTKSNNSNYDMSVHKNIHINSIHRKHSRYENYHKPQRSFNYTHQNKNINFYKTRSFHNHKYHGYVNTHATYNRYQRRIHSYSTERKSDTDNLHKGKVGKAAVSDQNNEILKNDSKPDRKKNSDGNNRNDKNCESIILPSFQHEHDKSKKKKYSDFFAKN